MTDVFVRPDVQQFLAMLAAIPGPKMHELTPQEARAQFLAARDIAELPIGELAVMRDITIPADGHAIPARLFDARETREPGPLLLFFHGGGFVIGSVETHAPLCAEMARVLDLPVLSVDYRLAPEHGWPAAPDDAETAARWAATSPEALGRRVTGLALAGDSAGGTLTIVTSLALRDAAAAVPVLAQFAIYPAVDLQRRYPSQDVFASGFMLTRESIAWFGDAYQADVQHMRASPMLADMHGMPPALVLTAGLDPIRDQGRAYAAKLIEAGVPTIYREARGNIHGFVTLRRTIPSSAADVNGALIVLRQMIAEQEAARVMAQADASR